MPIKNKKTLLTIVGPTAIGKTSLAIDLALHFGTEIISCDSRQFFKEMSIGTAVPSSEELAQVKHHFIQHKSIFDTYSVGDFERDVITLLKELFKQHNVVIMVGGSGLYADAVVYGLDDFPEVSPEIRNELNELYQKQGITYLQTRLKDLDSIQYTQMDIQNPQRMMRALEVCIASGKPYSSFLKKKKTLRDFTNITIGLTAEREVVYNRINRRVELMLEEGLLIEAQRLFPYKELNALQTVGYRELFDFLEGKTSLDFAVEEIKKNTRRFAKRQYTWFHKNKDIHWFEISQLDNLSISQLLDIQ
ncbi:tRNA (adenosine(37)-N6)-dimethylallyltransferase MiaA [Capnocytophaga sputigena]|jgi:tRNA dimethylallyltransferase|uniref:tRNA (adenosine(37)-N6)-dimethylallyltransferase MiaA n=1 Tax=Capnocytophaga sputigena TaxID=1019 RepID=UPI00241CCBF8|nr:tRNA (adenosine(37)-N6)-dimethylallyltransferase MiaA [Capnocytophaga sputigena]